MKLMKTTFLAAILLPGLAGCHVALQPYRLQHPAIEVPPPPPVAEANVNQIA